MADAVRHGPSGDGHGVPRYARVFSESLEAEIVAFAGIGPERRGRAIRKWRRPADGSRRAMVRIDDGPRVRSGTVVYVSFGRLTR